METANYDALRHFADSWGLVYMLVIFVAVALFLLRPGAKTHARMAAQIPLRESDPANEDNRP